VDIPFNSSSNEELRSIRVTTKAEVIEKTFDKIDTYTLMAQAMQMPSKSSTLYLLPLKILWKR
tara:strand:+ start:528 stop:716 length:189 start_codon:yes stop_codon:yes gene_type:complete